MSVAKTEIELKAIWILCHYLLRHPSCLLYNILAQYSKGPLLHPSELSPPILKEKSNGESEDGSKADSETQFVPNVP